MTSIDNEFNARRAAEAEACEAPVATSHPTADAGVQRHIAADIPHDCAASGGGASDDRPPRHAPEGGARAAVSDAAPRGGDGSAESARDRPREMETEKTAAREDRIRIGTVAPRAASVQGRPATRVTLRLVAGAATAPAPWAPMPDRTPPPAEAIASAPHVRSAPLPARHWACDALAWLAAERARAATTPIVPIPCPELPGITLLLKDESVHPSGSLKHRLTRALFAHAIASGAIGADTLVVEASSGSTAISEGWLARRLGLGFCAVVPATTAPAKRAAIRAEGGEIALAPPGADVAETAAALARSRGGYFIDQFSRAAEASDWRGADNIAAELLAQLEAIGFDPPAWIVAGAGTGGTAATIGRHLRTRADCSAVRLCVVDPEGSAHFKAFASGDPQATGAPSMVVEGIGRARVGASFVPAVIDHMVAVADEGSVAGAHWLAARIGRGFGPSTGTNLIGALILGQAMARRGECGTIVLIGGDGGDRYADTIYDADWCRAHSVAPAGWHALLARLGKPDFPAAY